MKGEVGRTEMGEEGTSEELPGEGVESVMCLLFS